jgi:hypothetical protein
MEQTLLVAISHFPFSIVPAKRTLHLLLHHHVASTEESWFNE